MRPLLLLVALLLPIIGCTQNVRFRENATYSPQFKSGGYGVLNLPDDIATRVVKVRGRGGEWLPEAYKIYWGEALGFQSEARFRGAFERGIKRADAETLRQARLLIAESLEKVPDPGSDLRAWQQEVRRRHAEAPERFNAPDAEGIALDPPRMIIELAEPEFVIIEEAPTVRFKFSATSGISGAEIYARTITVRGRKPKAYADEASQRSEIAENTSTLLSAALYQAGQELEAALAQRR